MRITLIGADNTDSSRRMSGMRITLLPAEVLPTSFQYNEMIGTQAGIDADYADSSRRMSGMRITLLPAEVLPTSFQYNEMIGTQAGIDADYADSSRRMVGMRIKLIGAGFRRKIIATRPRRRTENT